jgi:NTP pyrophosphatase (non-canonical NTP hydrolase)
MGVEEIMSLMDKVNKLAQHNGIQTVKSLLIDELDELIEAIKSGYEITQEVADVLNLIMQLTILEQNSEELDIQLAYKVNRAIERLGI